MFATLVHQNRLMYRFNQRGHLFPYRIHECSWENARQFFVDAFADSLKRRLLFENLEGILNRIRQEISPDFFVWIDGSFVENRQNPADIDVVIFMNFESLEAGQSILRNPYFGKAAKFERGIDLYFEPFYPPSHRKHFITHLQKLVTTQVAV